MAKEFRCYRTNKTNSGIAAAFQLSYKGDLKYNPYQMFLVMAKQTGVDDNGNASYDWKETAITVKLGDNDLGELIAVLEGRQDAAGYKGSLYHETPGGGNKVINFQRMDNGYGLKISAQDADKNKLGPYSIVISNGEAATLTTLLKTAVTRIYDW